MRINGLNSIDMNGRLKATHRSPDASCDALSRHAPNSHPLKAFDNDEATPIYASDRFACPHSHCCQPRSNFIRQCRKCATGCHRAVRKQLDQSDLPCPLRNRPGRSPERHRRRTTSAPCSICPRPKVKATGHAHPTDPYGPARATTTAPSDEGARTGPTKRFSTHSPAISREGLQSPGDRQP